ncbi:hypothetical protein QE152_g4721 [Popillia japonica]|uniref:Uncharacterized protein n=1 Tax=Popillia japonica TaxID=7064 RepID=A0AAW1N1W7_POPJA
MNFYRRIQWCDRFRDATHGLEVTAPGRITGEASPEHAPPMPAGGGHVHPGKKLPAPGRITGEASTEHAPPMPAGGGHVHPGKKLQNLEYLRNRSQESEEVSGAQGGKFEFVLGGISGARIAGVRGGILGRFCTRIAGVRGGILVGGIRRSNGGKFEMY